MLSVLDTVTKSHKQGTPAVTERVRVPNAQDKWRTDVVGPRESIFQWQPRGLSSLQ